MLQQYVLKMLTQYNYFKNKGEREEQMNTFSIVPIIILVVVVYVLLFSDSGMCKVNKGNE